MAEINKIFDVIEYIRKNVYTDLALPQLTIYLLVCLKEGVTQTEISNELNMPQGSVSRNLKILSKYFEETEDGKKEIRGYDLVRLEPDLEERRRLAVFLTKRGKAVKDEILNLLNEE